MFACIGFSDVLDLDGPKESDLEVSFNISFVRAVCLDYSNNLLGGFLSCFQVVVYRPLIWRGSGGILLISLFPVITGVPKLSDRNACD